MLIEVHLRDAPAEALQGGSGDLAHVVAKLTDSESAQARVLRSRVLGTPVTALCGVVYSPVGDPRSRPGLGPIPITLGLGLV